MLCFPTFKNPRFPPTLHLSLHSNGVESSAQCPPSHYSTRAWLRCSAQCSPPVPYTAQCSGSSPLITLQGCGWYLVCSSLLQYIMLFSGWVRLLITPEGCSFKSVCSAPFQCVKPFNVWVLLLLWLGIQCIVLRCWSGFLNQCFRCFTLN